MATIPSTTTTPTFNTDYITGYDELLNNSLRPNAKGVPTQGFLYRSVKDYGKMTDAYGNPIVGQALYEQLNSPNDAIAKEANAQLEKLKKNWVTDVLTTGTDPLTGAQQYTDPNSAAYKEAYQNLYDNPANNPRWVVQQNKITADKAAAANKTANETAITEKDLADQVALKKENELKLQTATAPLDVKKIGGGFDAAGNPISSNITAEITQEDINKGLLNVAKVGQAQTITNPNSAADVAKMVDAAKAVDVNVTPDSLVSNRLAGLLGKNNPYIQQAVNAANLQASRRGMLNTGAAAGFATDAAIKAALPIAQQDAATIQKANESNAAAANQLLNTGVSLKATSLDRQAQNDIQVQNWNAANKIAVDTANTNAINDAVKIFTTAMLNDKVNGASDARKNADALRQLITSGNIDIAKKAADATIAELASNRTLENDKQLAVFKSSLDIVLEEKKADLQHTRDVFIADADMTKAANVEIADLTQKFNSYIHQLNGMPDMEASTKAALANIATIKFYQDQKDVYKRYTSFSSLVNSDAGKTATALVSPTK